MITASTPASGWQIVTQQAELEERVRRRAYELYEQRGRDDGWDLDDWLLAESEFTQRKAQ
jgi:Protein of unknown function (DUF2934)